MFLPQRMIVKRRKDKEEHRDQGKKKLCASSFASAGEFFLCGRNAGHRK
jgi:hypothetical protein